MSWKCGSMSRPICPWCYKPQEFNHDYGDYQEIECSGCGEWFKAIRNVEITYDTERMEVAE